MKHKNNGFTLIEVVIASVTASIIVATFAVFAVFFFQTTQFSFDENVAISQAESTMRQFIGEIRQARPSDNGSYPLTLTNDQEFAFYADIDNDQDTERVRYFLEGTSIKRGVIEPTGNPATYSESTESVRIISDYIQNNQDPVFYYYNGDWPGDTINNPLASQSRLLETRLITVFLRVNINEQANPDAFELSSSIQLRNLKDNL